MERKNLRWQLPVLLIFIVATVYILHKQEPYQESKGLIFGTIYNATYQSSENLTKEIEEELKKVDASLSMFNDTSVISRINRNEDVLPDSMFLEVFMRAKEIANETEGAFDITVAPLVNAWGFGFKKNQLIDSLTVDSLKSNIGYYKVAYKNGRIEKQDERIMLDCGAIAKGYGSDVVARLFDRKGIRNYMIEIGGEVVVKGNNPKNTHWRIGISRPVDDSLSVNKELQNILEITNVGMATSGNYRNFYYKDGKKYAHTIDPRTGYPVQHSLLSATVIASDCMSADAYATSFMVMGLEKSKVFANNNPNVDAYFVYTDKEGKMQTCFTEGMKKYIAGEH